jgi:hypothetical protein
MLRIFFDTQRAAGNHLPAACSFPAQRLFWLFWFWLLFWF